MKSPKGSSKLSLALGEKKEESKRDPASVVDAIAYLDKQKKKDEAKKKEELLRKQSKQVKETHIVPITKLEGFGLNDDSAYKEFPSPAQMLEMPLD